MAGGLLLSSGPAAEPLTTAEAKSWLRVTSSDEDTLIDVLIESARTRAETFVNRAFINQTWIQKLDRFPGWEWVVPLPPISSVTTLTYLDTAGSSQSLTQNTDFLVHSNTQGFATLTPVYAGSWPATYGQGEDVTLTFVAGYGATSASIPEDIKLAVRIMVEHWFRNRDDLGTPPMNALDILRPYQVPWINAKTGLREMC